MPYEPPPSSIPPGSIVDAYLRDSGGLKQDRSVTRQLEALAAFCKQYNLILRTPYTDAAKSGTTTAGRDDFLRMISDYEIPANRPKALLIWNYARFARDVDDSQLYKAIIRRWGIVIHSLSDDIPEGRYGRLIEMLIEISNEEKAELTARDAADGLRSVVQQGAVPGNPPTGFKREPIVTTNYRTGEQRTNHRWVPDHDFIPRIRQAFEMRAAMASMKEIHKATHLFGSFNSYTTFFRNKLYIGILEFGEMIIENYCEPIVDRETWDAVQKIGALHKGRQHLSNSAHHPRRRSETSTYLLSGIIECGRCKSPLSGMTSGQQKASNYRRYACTRKQRRKDCDLQPIPAKAIEREVINKLTAFFDDPGNLQAFLDADHEQNADLASKNKARAKDLQKQINTLRHSITNITSAIAERGHSKAMLTKLADLEGQETTLLSQLNAVKTETPKIRPPLTAGQIAILSRRIVARLQSQDPAILRSILYGTVQKVTVDRTKTQAFGIISIHSPREPETPEDPAKAGIIAAPPHCAYITNPRGGTPMFRE